jgi:hypothetical protein
MTSDKGNPAGKGGREKDDPLGRQNRYHEAVHPLLLDGTIRPSSYGITNPIIRVPSPTGSLATEGEVPSLRTVVVRGQTFRVPPTAQNHHSHRNVPDRPTLPHLRPLSALEFSPLLFQSSDDNAPEPPKSQVRHNHRQTQGFDDDSTSCYSESPIKKRTPEEISTSASKTHTTESEQQSKIATEYIQLIRDGAPLSPPPTRPLPRIPEPRGAVQDVGSSARLGSSSVQALKPAVQPLANSKPENQKPWMSTRVQESSSAQAKRHQAKPVTAPPRMPNPTVSESEFNPFAYERLFSQQHIQYEDSVSVTLEYADDAPTIPGVPEELIPSEEERRLLALRLANASISQYTTPEPPVIGKGKGKAIDQPSGCIQSTGESSRSASTGHSVPTLRTPAAREVNPTAQALTIISQRAAVRRSGRESSTADPDVMHRDFSVRPRDSHSSSSKHLSTATMSRPSTLNSDNSYRQSYGATSSTSPPVTRSSGSSSKRVTFADDLIAPPTIYPAIPPSETFIPHRPAPLPPVPIDPGLQSR